MTLCFEMGHFVTGPHGLSASRANVLRMPRLIAAAAAASVLGLTARGLQRAVKCGLPAKRVGRELMFDPRDLGTWRTQFAAKRDGLSDLAVLETWAMTHLMCGAEAAPIVSGVYFAAATAGVESVSGRKATRPVRMVKIGAARDIRARLVDLQAMCPVSLQLLAFKPSDAPLKLEAAEHRQWRPFRHHGEWFQLAGALETYLTTSPDLSRPRAG